MPGGPQEAEERHETHEEIIQEDDSQFSVQKCKLLNDNVSVQLKHYT